VCSIVLRAGAVVLCAGPVVLRACAGPVVLRSGADLRRSGSELRSAELCRPGRRHGSRPGTAEGRERSGSSAGRTGSDAEGLMDIPPKGFGLLRLG
jgi:hypothetical protein